MKQQRIDKTNPLISQSDIQDSDNQWFDKTIVGSIEMLDPLTEDKGLTLKIEYTNLPLTMTPVIIGRDPKCTLQIRDGKVSRFHAIVYRFGKNFIIRDLNSTNGVFLNGVKISAKELQKDDEITISNHTIVVTEGPPLLAGYSNECAILFYDIANSTNLCEIYGDKFLNYVKRLVETLYNKTLLHNGCPVKNLGDGMMAAFGIWDDGIIEKSPVEEALAFAIEASALPGIRDLPEIHKRIGIAFGPVTKDETDGLDLYGDTVNLASRIEFSNKLYGTAIMMDSECYDRMTDKKFLREIDKVRVQGKNAAVTIYSYDLQAQSIGAGESMKSIIERNKVYRAGINAYRAGDFQKALLFFTKGAVMKDPPSRHMKQRVETILNKKTKLTIGNWDGIWNIEKE